MVDSILLYPIDSAFDLVSVDAFMMQQPDVLLDPLGTGIYMVCGLPSLKEVYLAKRLENPSEFPYVVLVTAKPDCINIFQEYGNKNGLFSARRITSWLIEHNKCRIEDEYFKDWTDLVIQQGVGILYPERLDKTSS
jgi:hypothetical protein